jgi:hypothetical protein
MHHKIKAIVFAMLATALMASSPVSAETIYLQCSSYKTFTIDLTNSTVDNLPATINATAIDWQFKGVVANKPGLTFVDNRHIDRIAGTFSHYATDSTGDSSHWDPVPCTVISAPPTKF